MDQGLVVVILPAHQYEPFGIGQNKTGLERLVI